MKIRLEQSGSFIDEKGYHLYLNNEHIGLQNEKETIAKVVALIRMSKCKIEIKKVNK